VFAFLGMRTTGNKTERNVQSAGR